MSNKEIELVDFLNKKINYLNDFNNKLSKAAKDDPNYNFDLANNYCSGYAAAIRDVKLILLKLLKGEIFVYDDEKKSS